MKQDALEKLRSGGAMTNREIIQMVMRLSTPAMLAQLSTIIMEYIDASMVGRLGAESSAAIGLVASSTWLFGGLNTVTAIGFTVPAAQAVGAGNREKARSLMRQGIVVSLLVSLFWMSLCSLISFRIPVWLGGDEAIRRNAGLYFLIFALTFPFGALSSAAGGFLQAVGDMKTPSVLQIVACIMDVLFNIVLIFPSGYILLGGWKVFFPGAGLGVPGAAIGTSAAHIICAVLMMGRLAQGESLFRFSHRDAWKPKREDLLRAWSLAAPVAVSQVVMSGAQIVLTRIITPLGTTAIAAHSLAVTAEGVCYMPGYGIGTAASTIIGQSVGAKRDDLTARLAWTVTFFGMAVMAASGALMYILAPEMIAALSPDPFVRRLGTQVLRIEAFAEAFFGASIVGAGVLRGAGDTLVPSAMNLFSIWVVRLPAAAFLAHGRGIGLLGVWIAMCGELCVRGILFLVRLKRVSFRKREDIL